MAPVLSNILQARQSSSSSGSSDSCNCPNTISGGGIAGIVLGTIVGVLLLIWLFKVCSLPGAPAGGDPDDYAYSRGGGTEVRSTHRRRRSSPLNVEYVEKPRRSRRYRDDVRRPAKVYLN